MRKRCYSISAAVLAATALFALSVDRSVIADSFSANQEMRYTNVIPSNVTSVWTKGITPPTNFIEGTDVTYAPYVANQGWYDITKKFNGKDDLLCGAATAGNMLHWWFDQNKDQIEHYLKEHPEKQKIIFNDVQMFDLKDAINTKDYQLDSKLFEYFREKAFPTLSAKRRGVFPDHVIDMFINGYRLSSDNYGPTPIKEGNKDPRGGIFDHVFGRGEQSKLLTERHDLRYQTIDKISLLIKQKLEEGKAIGISHSYANVSINHVINLWGADFDSNGNLKAIYVTDSDSNASVGMKKYFVGVNSAGKVAISAKEIEGDNVGAQVLGIFTLSTGQDIWNQNS
ncbi:IdeS/Mac family cysteine endopeptidase [Streptococcus halichoeri]|uniref:IdeS/Mac family cysteine endopeptidase n=1 Tax=Streptococcus halichoeri TaxID=254785 RepID=UPI001358B9E3|nr:IdeS/Mac family cysteine endopeptidase [Streptococcus halichoeri]